MSRVGVPRGPDTRDPLDVRIEEKSFQSGSGEKFVVLRDFSLRLRSGEIAALVGPSGCGKSTLLRLAAGLDTDFTGEIARPARDRLGMVFQEPRLLPWRSVIQNLRVAAPRATASALDALLKAFHIDALRDRYPGELSGGQARRVALARAFAVEPELLLLDEPFVSLDAALAAALRAELAAIVENGRVTTLLVTHDLDEAIELADRLILMAGRPARVVADIAIAEPRGARTSARISEIKADALGRAAAAAP